MADTLADQLSALERERDRLEQYLALEADWRALRQLDEREAAGEPVEAVDGRKLRLALVRSLSANRIFAAREKIVEAIGLLNGSTSAAAAAPDESRQDLAALRSRGQALSSRIVLLAGGASDFKSRLKLKPSVAAPSDEGGRACGGGEPERCGDDVAPGPLHSCTSAPETAEVADASRSADLAGAAAAAPRPDTDRLDLICGLGPEAVARLAAGGIRSCSDVARWSAADALAWRQRLTDCARGPAGQWIEQAAILAVGRTTRHADLILAGGRPALAAMPPPEPPRPDAAEPNVAALTVPSVMPPTIIRIEAEELGYATGLRVEIAASEASARAGDDTGIEAFEAEGAPASASRMLASDEAEFEVAAMRPAPPPLPASPAAGLRGSLVSRLRASREPERFDSARYAAYRGVVEEASVTIIRQEGPPPDTADLQQPFAVEERPEPVDRFLNALLGKP